MEIRARKESENTIKSFSSSTLDELLLSFEKYNS
jgi:hypothetical protein